MYGPLRGPPPPIIYSFFISSESPVPLEFTPVLGILIGVVLTLFLIALVIILVLRIKYKSSVAASRKRWAFCLII